MPVIIDTNCLGNVFKTNSVKHEEFKPVLEWIIKGKGKIVYGGTKYLNELASAQKYSVLFRELRALGKAYIGDKKQIDDIHSKIEANNTDERFNDAHLVAIVIATKCRVICSEDTESIPFVKDKKHYPPGTKIPVYYTSKINADLLCDGYVDNSLKPLCKITKDSVEQLEKRLGT